MSKNIKCKNCNNLHRANHWCEKVLDSPDEERLRDCRHFWERTNGDRIRSMSDEELAKFLGRVKEPCDYCQLADYAGACTESLCDDAMMKWIQQIAEVD